ncbi:MAG TPA: hypothetical protein VK078_06515 [Pseudogracilibacillus sp.]|nr:hypothetical protein [Pseudogracilibacillus sp.]
MIKKIKTIKHIILIYYVIVLFLVLLFTFALPHDGSINKTIIVILGLYLLFFPIVMVYTLRYALHIFLFSLAFISGFYGFYHHSIDAHSVSNALYFTFRLYLLDLADVFTEDGTSPNQYPALLEIARWSAASYTISTIFIAMYRSLEKNILLYLTQALGKHHIVFSYNEKSQALIEDLRKHRERVIVVDETFSPETQNMLEGMNVSVVQATINEKDLFHVCAAKKAASISLFHEKDQDSLYVLMKIEEFARKEKAPLALKKLLIHMEENHYKKELTSFLNEVEHFSFPVEVVNVYEEIAKRFWKKHPLVIEGEKATHLLIVGYDNLGQQIAAEANKVSRKNELNHECLITVLGDFTSRANIGNMEMIPFNIKEESFTEILKSEQKQFTHIFICLDEDNMDLLEGIELSELFPEIPIYMNFTNESIEQTFMIATTETEKSLYSIGMMRDVITKDYLNL